MPACWLATLMMLQMLVVTGGECVSCCCKSQLSVFAAGSTDVKHRSVCVALLKLLLQF